MRQDKARHTQTNTHTHTHTNGQTAGKVMESWAACGRGMVRLTNTLKPTKHSGKITHTHTHPYTAGLM